jgi:hypothetical protein
MAKRSVAITTITPAAYANGVALVDATFPFMAQGGSSVQQSAISEIYMGGQATAQAATLMVLGTNSTAAATNSLGAGQSDNPLHPATAALTNPVLTGNTNTTDPQRGSILLNLSFNAFGGLVRWVAYPGEEVWIVGNALTLGSISVSAFTGGSPGALGGHMIYETA